MGYANIKAFATKITVAAADTQIFTSPWRAQRKYYIKKLILTAEGAVSTVKFFDDDLLNATPPVRGDSAAAPLLEFIVPAASTLIIDKKQLPNEFFISGLVGNSDVANVVVMVEIEED